MRSRIIFVRLLPILMVFASAVQCWATVANAWHIPDNSADLNGTHMRNPWIEISNNPASPTTITIYSGLQKFNNSFGTADQNGGTLFYKGASEGAWHSVAMSFDVNNGNNQYWKGQFSTAAIAANDVIQYYLSLTFNSGA